MGITKLGSFRQREVCFQKIGHEGLRGRSGVAPPTVKANLGDDVGARRVGNFLGAGCWGVLYFATIVWPRGPRTPSTWYGAVPWLAHFDLKEAIDFQ